MSHETPEIIAEKAREWLAEYIVKKDELKPKDRLAIPSQPMAAQDPIERGRNLDEVAVQKEYLCG